jgi:hypothetical protein
MDKSLVVLYDLITIIRTGTLFPNSLTCETQLRNVSISNPQIEAKRQKKEVVAENGAESISIDAGECTIIDDELEEDLRKLGDLEPLERQLIRLEGLEPYVLVSVLTATASYSTITSENFVVDGVIDWTGAGLLASALGSTLCGLYSTIIFSLSILYGKTALGE